MKILHTESSRGWGGQEIRILEESSGMIEHGHEVHLLCPFEAPIYAEADCYGVPVTALPIERKHPAGALALRRWLARHPVDVINTHSSTDSWLAAIACRTMARPPAIVRTRHIFAPIPDNMASRWLYTSAVQHVVTTGERLREQLIAQFGLPPERITSVPTGIDPARFFPADKAEARRILGLDPAARYMGIIATLRSWKGHVYLLEAFAALARPDWTLLIVGEGPMREPIEAKIGELGLSGQVRLVGQQDRPELWMRALDIFCLPSYANEGVPQAILQAMLTALPIVTTPVGAILEAVSDGDSALIVPPRDPGALASALRRLLDEPVLAEKLGAEALRIASARFTKDVMIDRMEWVFSTVVKRRA